MKLGKDETQSTVQGQQRMLQIHTDLLKPDGDTTHLLQTSMQRRESDARCGPLTCRTVLLDADRGME